jgi:hypothetical protein
MKRSADDDEENKLLFETTWWMCANITITIQ